MLSVRSFEGVISGKTQFSQWKKHKTVNTHRKFRSVRQVSPMQIVDWIQACWDRRNSRKGGLPDPTTDPCAQALLAYIIVTSFYKPSSINIIWN